MNAQARNGHAMNGQQHNQAAHAIPLVCPNGHGGVEGGGRFCNRCGAQLIAGIAPGDAQRQQFPAPPQQFNAQVMQRCDGQPQPPLAVVPNNMPVICHTCGGQGRNLTTELDVCPQCRWLRPLTPHYAIDPAAFQWAQDGQAMARLRSLSTLTSLARSISDRAGRRWIEATFNGVRLSERQMPQVYGQAVKAARILGLTQMPDIYISGERPWDAMTFGSDTSAFVVLGSAMVNSFQGDELLFLFARQMGHIRAGHALWKTVIRFLVGEQNPRTGMMKDGVLGLLDPGKWIEGAIEAPLLGWARQAEITADRAGLLALGDEEVARRVLLSWSLKSPVLYRHINVAAWLEQQAEADDETLRLSEMMSSATPYITRRLKLMTEFAHSPALRQWRTAISPLIPRTPAPAAPQSVPFVRAEVKAADKDDALRLVCPACQTGNRVPRQALAGRESLNVRCSRKDCGRVVTLRRKAAPAGTAAQRQEALRAVE